MYLNVCMDACPNTPDFTRIHAIYSFNTFIDSNYDIDKLQIKMDGKLPILLLCVRACVRSSVHKNYIYNIIYLYFFVCPLI